MWMLSYEYRHHTSSLNHAQAVPDSKGLYRWVISAADPGVHNGLDSSGNACGPRLLRSQYMPPGAQLAGCVSPEVVKLQAPPSPLPPEPPYHNAPETAPQRPQRTKDPSSRNKGHHSATS